MKNKPPRADRLPVLGNVIGLTREQEAFYERLQDTHGDMVSISLPRFGEQTLVMNPENTKELLMSDDFGKTQMFRKMLGEILGNGLFLSEGEHWMKQRERMQPAFFRERVLEYAPEMAKVTNKRSENWESGEVMDVETEMKNLTFEILLTTMFGQGHDFDSAGLREARAKLSKPTDSWNLVLAYLVPKTVPIPLWNDFFDGIDTFDDFIQDLVDDERTSTDTSSNMLSLMLEGTDSSGESMDDEDVRDEMMTLLFAGHSTTATAFTFALYSVAANPEIQKRLHEEVDSVLGDRSPTPDDFSELPYTTAIIKESMRLYPPVPIIMREAKRVTMIGEYTFSEGDVMTTVPWTIHRDSRWWDNPEEFRPERWLGEDTDRPQFAYFPFGGGPRKCIGEGFAMTEAQIVLSSLAQDWEFSVADGVSTPTMPVQVDITTSPEEDVELIPTKR